MLKNSFSIKLGFNRKFVRVYLALKIFISCVQGFSMVVESDEFIYMVEGISFNLKTDDNASFFYHMSKKMSCFQLKPPKAQFFLSK